MGKRTVVAALAVTLLLGACSQKAPQPPPPPTPGPTMPSVSPASPSPTSAADRKHADLLAVQALFKAEFAEEKQVLNDGASQTLELAFFDKDEDTRAPMTGICGVDAEAFTAALVAAGYSHQPAYGIHGGLTGDDFTRDGVRAKTQTRGESEESDGKSQHRCITSVWIRRDE